MTEQCPPLPEDDLAHILGHTRELWPGAKGKSFFITGGTGFVGIWLLESFAYANETLGLNARAVVLSREPEAFQRRAPHLAHRAGLTFVKGDVRDLAVAEEVFDYVIHAATAVADRDRPAQSAGQMLAILEGTQHVAKFAASAKARHLLYVSSGAVYGAQPADLAKLPESYCGGPETTSIQSGYGIGKRAAEHLLAMHAITDRLQLKIARCFSFVGPHLDADRFAIGNFIRDAMAGQPVRIRGDGTPQRSYLYAADLAIWLWTILFRGTDSRIYNVGSEVGITIRDCAKVVVEAVNPSLAVEVGQPAITGASAERYVPHTGRARIELQLQEQIPLSEAIRRTVAWLRTAPPTS